jgi:hypothetical protein
MNKKSRWYFFFIPIFFFSGFFYLSSQNFLLLLFLRRHLFLVHCRSAVTQFVLRDVRSFYIVHVHRSIILIHVLCSSQIYFSFFLHSFSLLVLLLLLFYLSVYMQCYGLHSCVLHQHAYGTDNLGLYGN